MIILSILHISLSWTFWVCLVIIAICFWLSAVVSSSENAFFSLSASDIMLLRESDSPNDTALWLLNDRKRLLATILIVNNFVNIIITLLLAYVVSCLFDFSEHVVLGFIIDSVLITFLLLLFCEITPKLYAAANKMVIVNRFSGLLRAMVYTFYPFSSLLVKSSRVFDSVDVHHSGNDITMDELSQAIELTNIGNEKDKEMLEGIASFGNKCVVDVMHSRLDIVGIDVRSSFADLLKLVKESGYSRIPVYSESMDNIKGIVFSKDLIAYLDKPSNFKWQTLMRQAYFVPESKRLRDLLDEFQENKMHLAIVVDEYGGTSGLITLEDILEEVVGDISDEYDEDERLYTQIDDNTFDFAAQILLNDFYKVTGIDSEVFDKFSSEVETLAGLILEIRGELPKKGEVINYRNYSFTITGVDKRKIKNIRLHINDNTDEKE